MRSFKSADPEEDVADAGFAEALLDFLEEQCFVRAEFLDVGGVCDVDGEASVAEVGGLTDAGVEFADDLGPTFKELRFPEPLFEAEPLENAGNDLGERRGGARLRLSGKRMPLAQDSGSQLRCHGYAPSSPMASTGQPSFASRQRDSSSGFTGWRETKL